ncbi:hypothetical protein ABZW47_05510 [Streptomyces sp. NPDC004549]|uniref:hypothetical protein n=1 Tax=Streptomyces sp. NPDC004549 TaxID=3154283 RepID=UPI0033A23739
MAEPVVMGVAVADGADMVPASDAVAADRGSSTPAVEPPAGCAALAEWWYTLVNSLRWAGNPERAV